MVEASTMPKTASKANTALLSLDIHSPKESRKLPKMIQDQTRDGADLVDFLMNVWRGDIRGSTLQHRILAVHMLLDRGFGKVGTGEPHPNNANPR